MIILRSVSELKDWRAQCVGSVGFVPTMGALHAGHASLVNDSKNKCAVTVVSIFVNPTQFNNKEDLAKYPRMEEKDFSLLRDLKVDAVFVPVAEDLYPDAYRFSVQEKELSQKFCGAHRPGHFEGMLTVVLKLFGLVKPDFAFFGEKDFQQLSLVREMCAAFFLDCQVIACPTLREEDGLAMSSRNLRLNVDTRAQAPILYQILKESKSATEAREKLLQIGFESVDYVEDWRGRRLAAVQLGAVRLIDNIPLEKEHS